MAPAFAQEVLRLHHFNSPRSAAHVKFLDPWAEAVTEASNSSLEIQIYPSMQLGGKQRDLFGQVRDGVVAAGGAIIKPDVAAKAAFATLAEPIIEYWVSETTLSEGDTETLYNDAC
nr:hypothetical protein [Marinicella sp. W31]MDC2875411.1 hypothetical protein [Marinicella sp. W31]